MQTVLHVLPHPGGGGETYVDSLERMEDYRFERTFLAPSPRPTPAVLAGATKAQFRTRNLDLVHVHGEVAAACMLPVLAIRRSVVTLHGLHLLRRLDGKRRLVAALNLRLVVRAASATICVSEAEREDVVATVGTKAAERVVVIHNGVTPSPRVTPEERHKARQDLGIPSGAVVGAFIGSLHDHKDPLVAVGAALAVASEGTPLVLAVAGDGPLRDRIEQLAADGGVVRALGHRDDARGVLAAADFFVLPSQREGFSYALLEAMALGLPVVVSDAPGNPEAVGDTGIVASRGNTGAFADAFRRLLEPDVRAALGEQARRRALESFSAHEMVQRTRDIYGSVTTTTNRHLG